MSGKRVRAHGPAKPDPCTARTGQAMLRIQRVNSEQLEAAIRLLRAQFEEHAISIPPKRLEAAVARLIEMPDRGALLLAIDDDEPVGLAALAHTWTLEHGGLVAWLDELYVVPHRRGEGLGRALLTAACDLAKRAGCAAIELEVDAPHRRAESLYRRAGYEPLARSRWSQRLALQRHRPTGE
jgi:GNAT superfamily N-acetyltransferase